MTLHAPIKHDENDPHPEQPARIVGVYSKLQSAFSSNPFRLVPAFTLSRFIQTMASSAV